MKKISLIVLTFIFCFQAQAQVNWTSRTSAADNQWFGVTYGDELFVAVAGSGTGDRVMTSSDGINWYARASVEDANWYGVTYGNGLFVAIAFSGTNRVMTSPDGINWTPRTAAAANEWRSITYGNGLFVAVASSGTNRVMTSPNGITWTARTSAENNNWGGVVYGNGLFVAVSFDGTNRVMTSLDGITWTPRAAAVANAWYGITYGNGLFVATAIEVGPFTSGRGNRVMTSPDGITWTPRTSAADNTWYTVTYGNGLFVALSDNGTNRVMTSPDGITWTAESAAVNNAWSGITYGNGLFVAVAFSGTGNRVMTANAAASRLTIDPIASQAYSGAALTPAIVVKDDATTLTLGTHYSVAYTNNTNAGTATATITGMDNYTGTKTQTFAIVAKAASGLTIDDIANQTYTGSALIPALVVKDGATTLTLDTDYTVAYTDNTDLGTATVTITGMGNYTGTRTFYFLVVEWASRTSAADNDWTSVTYGNGLFVAIAATGAGNRVMTSSDGITWTPRIAAAANEWRSITSGNGLFVAVASSGTDRVMTSPDGMTWTARTAAAANEWRSVTYGNGVFVAVASSGTDRVMTSPDGITWTPRTAAAANEWRSITHGNGLFVAVASSGTGSRVMSSSNGIVWTVRTSAVDSDWTSVTYGNGVFVAVAGAGTGSRVMSSSDGIAWTARTAAAANQWRSITYGNGLFVAVASTGEGDRVMSSSDGLAWTLQTYPLDNNWKSLTYHNGLFVAVASSGAGNRVMTLNAAVSRLTVDAIANQAYTGAALTPGVTVEDDEVTLTLDTHYSTEYFENTNLGTATVVITGMGSYRGATSQTFAIVPRAASGLTIDAIANQTYTGAPLTPVLVVKDGSTTLTLGTHYSVAFSNNTNAGTATATITGMGNYTGTKTQTFVIVKAASSLTIDPIADQTYSGLALTPAVVVKDGSTTLTATTDYTVAYGNNTNVGTATVTITGAGNYTGTKTQTFTIVAKAASTLTIDAIADQTYTGSALTPAVVVKDGSTTLTSTTDYTVSYTNNTNVGTATVTITGAGNYTGTKTQTFTIVAKAASTLSIDAIANQTYTGLALTPAVVVKDGSTTLTATADYTIAYTNNTNVGTATVTITGAGNYSGTKTQNFTIITKAASTLSIDAIVNQTYTGLALTPAVVVKDGSTTLTATTDYIIAYSNNTNVGTGTVTITGAGNYSGSKTQTFTIVTKAASTLSIDAIPNQTYTGLALTPAVVVKDGSTTLTSTTDYTVSYTNNTNVGTATVTITGAGNYSGSKTQTFTIVTKAASTLSIDAIANQTYTGAALTPVVIVKDGITTLNLGIDYLVAYFNNTNVGTATVTIAGIGTYASSKTQTFAIVAKASSTLSIDAIANQTYTGLALTPAVVVKDGNTTLTATTDYTVAYSNNTNVGMATVTLRGLGNYTGTKTQTFAIVSKAVSGLTIGSIPSQNYTGAAITPAVVVKDGATVLTLSTDYTIAYSNNTNVGTATVTMTGAGNYSGSKTQTFAIISMAVSSLTIDPIADQIFTGSALTPVVVVKEGSTTLTLGIDYSVAYFNNTNVGTATVTITGVGTYTGTKTQTFAIAPKAVTIKANNASKIYGDANPSLSFTYSGLVDGDTEIDQAPSISTSATTTSGVGSYRVLLSGGSDPNYRFTLQEGVLEVSPAPLSLSVNAATKSYGQADPDYTYRVQGLKGADTETVIRGALSRVGGEDPGSYRIAAGTISAGANYTLSVVGANLQILKASVFSVNELALVTTEWSKEAALPTTANVLTTHGQYFRVEVKWDKSSLNVFARGTYSLTGTLKLPSGIENPNQVFAKVQVHVLPKPAPLDLTLTNNSFAGSTSTFYISVGDVVVNDPVDKIHVASLTGLGHDNRYFEIRDNTLYWSSADPVPGKTAFNIVVRVTDRDGNTLDKLFEINRLRPAFSSVTIYNTFTPNGDRFNDTWGAAELRFYEGTRISVYERGGGRVFYTENPDIRWDGIYHGKEMPIGSYYWVIQIGESGETRRGTLHVIRK